MTITLSLTLEPPHDALDDPNPVGWTTGYVVGLLRAGGLVVHGATVPLPALYDDPTQVALDVGPGVRRALAEAADAMHEIGPDDDAEPDPRPFHELLVDEAQRERRSFDPDAARARAAAAIDHAGLGMMG